MLETFLTKISVDEAFHAYLKNIIGKRLFIYPQVSPRALLKMHDYICMLHILNV